MSGNWEPEINGIDVRRRGDDASIQAITVNAERCDKSAGSCGRVRLNCEYRVAEDRCASLHHAERGGHDATGRVHTHHLIGILPAVERAVEAVPGVEWVESLEDTIGTRRDNATEEQ